MTTFSLAILLPLAASAAEVKLILHADDFGMCHSQNRATIELLDTNSVSSASIMMPCPWVLEAAEYARKHPDKDIGLHLTLTSEWHNYRWGPVAPRGQALSLVDPDGYFWHTTAAVAQHATAGDVEHELRAQIQKARSLGIRFTHLDTHMGTLYSRPDLFAIFEKLGKEYGVPILRMKPDPALEAQAPPAVRRYLEENEPRFQAEKLFRLDSLLQNAARGTRTLEERREAYHRAIRALKPGVHMLIIHAAVLDDELKAITASAVQRDEDYRVFLNSQPFFKEAGVTLVGWRDVAPHGMPR